MIIWIADVESDRRVVHFAFTWVLVGAESGASVGVHALSGCIPQHFFFCWCDISEQCSSLGRRGCRARYSQDCDLSLCRLNNMAEIGSIEGIATGDTVLVKNDVCVHPLLISRTRNIAIDRAPLPASTHTHTQHSRSHSPCASLTSTPRGPSAQVGRDYIAGTTIEV
jgi:hypothetical protein